MPNIQEPPSRGVALIVDDEQMILRLATTVLASAGFRPVVAENGVTGFETYVNLRDQIAFVLADVVMPGGSGLDMARRIKEIDSEAKIVIMSGYSDAALEVEARKLFPYLRKPFLREDLLRKVSEVLAAHVE